MNRKALYNYQSYLDTPEWKNTSFQCKQAAGFRCQLCNAPDMPWNRLQTHHRRYEKVNGNEKPNDLICLCNYCHRSVHKFLILRKGELTHVEEMMNPANDPSYPEYSKQLELDLGVS